MPAKRSTSKIRIAAFICRLVQYLLLHPYSLLEHTKETNPCPKFSATLSDALAAAVETAGPSIVRVEARRRLPASGIVWSADGMIVTAHHVVEQDENIGIGLADGRTVSASLVGRDPTTDIAVLRARGQRVDAADLGRSRDPQGRPPGLGAGPPGGERDGDPGHRRAR